MKTNLVKILSVGAGLCVLGTTLYAQGGSRGTDSRIGSIRHAQEDKQAITAKAISKEEAAKNYPVKGGAYPRGDRDPSQPSGIVTSPYPPHERYDCSKVNHGGLVLDERAKKLFVYP